MALNIYEPNKFKSQGIEDLATQESLIITNGKITVDTVEAKKAISFAGASFSEVDGIGLVWTDGRKTKKVAYNQGTLWTDLDINLKEEQVYRIDNVSVLSNSELGHTVTKSNLKQLGTLKNLKVSGSAEFGQFAYAISDLNRFGINTESPAAALGIRENNVEIIVGSIKAKTAAIGTTTNDHIELITDNTARITIKNNGEVVIGSEGHRSGILRVNGTLYVDDIVTGRSTPLTFKETDNNSISGKGIVWLTKNNKSTHFLYQANPEKIVSTETIDLSAEKYFSIDDAMVLSKTNLGMTVVESNLTTLGILKDLQVAGDVAVTRTLSTSRLEIGKFAVDENRLEFTNNFNIQKNNLSEFKIGTDIVIGNSENITRPVSIYGRMTVGVANPQEGVALTVAGPVSFDNKKFMTGNDKPTTGSFNKGDIVWNADPKSSDYIGWVCITAGSPGQWLAFGAIANR